MLPALAFCLGALLAPPPAPVSVARATDRYTPVVMSVMSTPRWFKGTDRRYHLVYELALTNGLSIPVTVTAVSVRDVGRNRTIERLSGRDLTGSMTLMTSPTEPTTNIPGSSIGVVWLDVAVKRRGDLPRRISHRLTVRVTTGLPIPATIADTGGAARVDLRPPVVLGPPLRGSGWIALAGCCDSHHRRSLQPVNGKLHLGQRFAIDWDHMVASGRIVVGNPDVNRSWTCYGKPVLAVANATVAQAVDRFPDQIANHPKPVTIDGADGNHVILALGHGRYAYYAHLRPGSVRVRRGQYVRRGQVIGLLGNSGNSGGPHLHFQVMDRPSALASNGLPYVFSGFQLAGRIPPLSDALIATISAGTLVPVDRARTGRRHGELPLSSDVLNFASS